MNGTKMVNIPAHSQHMGRDTVHIKLVWVCPVCGGPRGDIHTAFSYDGSMRLVCDGWENPCGHVDLYANVRQEARRNGLNGESQQ